MSSQETSPKEFMSYHSNPKMKVFVGSLILKNVPGALAAVTTILADNRVNLIASESANIMGTGKSVWGFFAEAGKEEGNAPRIRHLLESSPLVLKAIVEEGFSGVVVDKYHYPLQFTLGQRAMVFRRENVADMFERTKRTFGTGAALIIYEMGVAAGQSDGKDLFEKLGEDLVLANLEELLFIYSAQGWGRPELVNLDFEPLRAKLRIYDNFECSHTKSTSPNSHYIRGHLAGLANVFFAKKVLVREVKCVSMGDRYCEFEATEQSET